MNASEGCKKSKFTWTYSTMEMSYLL
jgi:uncharacterized cupin superfamily protein